MYWTHSRFNRVKNKSGKCPDERTLTHVLWYCVKVQDFWTSVHDCIQRIIGQDISFCICLFLLGDTSTLKGTISFTYTELGRSQLVQH